MSFGKPIPGYTGHGRRIAADNIYGCTFANARVKAGESHGRIEDERDTNLEMVSSQIPKLGKANCN